MAIEPTTDVNNKAPMTHLQAAATLAWLLLPSVANSFSPLQPSTAFTRQIHIYGSEKSYARHASPIAPSLASSATDDIDQSYNASSMYDAKQSSRSSPKESKKLDMPWSDIQKYALEDNLPKFTVMIATNGASNQYAMWRTLTREVTELAGYPIPFLVQMHQTMLSKEVDNKLSTPGVLPMVDDFEFAPNGGITGRAYGLPGIADGTKINTPPLIGVETTVPLGYVTTSSDTEEGVGFSYELGTCASSSVYSLDGSERSAALLSARRMMMESMDVGVASSRQVASVAKDAVVAGSGLLTDADANQDLMYLGGATAMLLASATAVGMLSHHLTVNVFWV